MLLITIFLQEGKLVIWTLTYLSEDWDIYEWGKQIVGLTSHFSLVFAINSYCYESDICFLCYESEIQVFFVLNWIWFCWWYISLHPWLLSEIQVCFVTDWIWFCWCYLRIHSNTWPVTAFVTACRLWFCRGL